MYTLSHLYRRAEHCEMGAADAAYEAREQVRTFALKYGLPDPELGGTPKKVAKEYAEYANKYNISFDLEGNIVTCDKPDNKPPSLIGYDYKSVKVIGKLITVTDMENRIIGYRCPRCTKLHDLSEWVNCIIEDTIICDDCLAELDCGDMLAKDS